MLLIFHQILTIKKNNNHSIIQFSVLKKRNHIQLYSLVMLLTMIAWGFPSVAQHKNILICDKDNPEEATICMNPKMPNILVGGANISNYFFSNDTGRTWRSESLNSKLGVWGDPCVITDSLGHFYYFHLSNTPGSENAYDRVVCQKSYDKGISWNKGSFLGLNNELTQDKPFATIDLKTNNIYITWTQLQEKDINGKAISDILFSVSKDEGKTWSKGLKINQECGTSYEKGKIILGVMPTVGPNGEIYATWSSEKGIIFDKSLDTGKTWMAEDITIAGFSKPGWSFEIPGVYRCYSFPIIACDVSNSEFRGNIYITWFDKKKGKKDTDIWLARSSDGGKSWTNPQKVNNDSTAAYQYLPWISIDQANGNVYLLFYDRREYTDNRTDMYMARSTDGGKTFINFKINERTFTPQNSTFMGDYNGIAVYNNIVRPIWTAIDNHSKTSIWTAIINTDAIEAEAKDKK